jgi:hypothetical protein
VRDLVEDCVSVYTDSDDGLFLYWTAPSDIAVSPPVWASGGVVVC